jgi:hypothetical protein
VGRRRGRPAGDIPLEHVGRYNEKLWYYIYIVETVERNLYYYVYDSFEVRILKTRFIEHRYDD